MGDVAPVGHALRSYMHSIWIRFHSLPESKRYPDNEFEIQELIARHRQVADELFVPGEQLYVYQSRYPMSKRRTKARQSIAGRQLREGSALLPVNPLTIAREDDDLLLVRALVTTWEPDFFGQLVRDVAQEREYMVTLVSPASKNVYCPYDGGMDIFATTCDATELATRYAAWLPCGPGRL